MTISNAKYLLYIRIVRNRTERSGKSIVRELDSILNYDVDFDTELAHVKLTQVKYSS